MNPLDRFEFSQSSLQDYVDCRRRFWLRYYQRIAWPAVPAEPARENERHMQRGERFHRLAQQYLLGVPADRLACMADADEDEHLRLWWQNFEDSVPRLLSGQRFVETTLAAPLDCYRLVAKYDLVQVQPDGCVQIFDWKTSLRRPRSSVLRARLQSRVYPYLLVQAGAALTGGRPVAPEQIEMIYWFAEPTQPPERIAYSRAQWQADDQYLRGLVRETRALPPDSYDMTQKAELCAYCVFRSLCDRGACAGDLHNEALEDDQNIQAGLTFDLEQIAEISF